MKKIAMLLMSMLTASTAVATNPLQPSAPYSADFVLETAQATMQGKIHVAGSKERREMVQDGERIVMILRPDKKLTWQLIPEERAYLEMKYGERGSDEGDLSRYDIEQTTVGEEVVNGVRTTKSKILMKEKPPKTGKLGGFWWTTREGIVVKIDAISVEKQGKQRIKSELKNLKVGRQDPGLFEIPAGYSKMSMGMPDLGEKTPGAKTKGKKDATKETDSGADAGGLGLKDALRLLK